MAPNPLKKALKARLKAPLGPVLEALVDHPDLGPESDDPTELFYLVEPEHEQVVGRCQDRYGIEILGRSHDQLAYFGVPAVSDAATVDQRPVVLVDNKGIDPQVVARNLADFLGLVAWCPVAFGQSPEEWKKCRREAREERGDEVERLEEALCSLPGVQVPKSPWKLQEALPAVELKPRVGGKAAKALKADEVKRRVEALFRESFEGELHLLWCDEVGLSGRELQVAVGLDAPEEVGQQLAREDVVRRPLQRFRERLAAELPDLTAKVGLFVEDLDMVTVPRPGEPDVWARLKSGLSRVGQPEVYQRLAARR